MELNPIKIEMFGVNKLKDILNRCERLIPEINSNDKTPSWNGDIFVYCSRDLKKDTVEGVIRIQVKGKHKKITSEKITHPVEVADLENYERDGGVIYFVIYLEDFNTYKVYYNALLPFYFKNIINS